MPFQLTEIPAKADMMLMADILIAQHKNLMPEQARSQPRYGLRIKRLAEINPADFSSENRSQRGEVQTG